MFEIIDDRVDFLQFSEQPALTGWAPFLCQNSATINIIIA